MTAIGFVLFIIALALRKGWGADPFQNDNRADNAAYICAGIGMLLMLAGVAMFLWRVMP